MKGQKVNSADDRNWTHTTEGDDAIIGKALRWSLAAASVLGMVVVGIAVWLSRPAPTPPATATTLDLPQVRQQPSVKMPSVRFTNITDAAGIDFVHENGATGDKLLPETLGGGCAFLDYDNDGDQDLLLVNSCRWPWDSPQPDPPARTVLYRNDGTGHFTDVTDDVGLEVSCYGMGVAVGDYDNNGYVDVFISAVGQNVLLHNAEGRFVDVTQSAGVSGDPEQWSTSCGWLDYDNDGDLDLFVCNYVQWSKQIDQVQEFRLVGVGRAYGPPTAFQGTFPYLYRNDGDGRFTDVSATSGVQQTNMSTGVPLAKSLGLAPVDIDRDGWIDLVVANDTVRNLVFRNQADGTFQEIGVTAGIAFDAAGQARGAMGIDAVRFRDDDSLGIAIGNFANEMTALYVSAGTDMLFTDDAIPTGLGPPTRQELSFGLVFFDFDLDGRLDLLAANGHLENEIHKVQESQNYRQSASLFWNAGPQQISEFVRVPAENCGPDLLTPIVGRGAAYADIDGDGDQDVLLTQIAGPPLLLRNDQQLGHHYLRFKLIGTRCNRDAIGAWLEVRIGQSTRRRQVMPTRSYLAQMELPVTIGLGQHDAVDGVSIQWPDGSIQQVENLLVDGLTVIEQQ